MKSRNLIPSLMVFSILIISLMYTNSVTSQTPSTTLQTGDTLRFTNDGWETEDSYRFFEMGDAYSIGNEWYEEEISWSDSESAGEANLFFVKERPNLPAFQGYDTLAAIDSWGQNLPGSQRGGERNELRYDDSGNLVWFNNTFPNEDISYRRYEENEEILEIYSNTTYAIMFPEMLDDTFILDFGNDNCDGPDCGSPIPDIDAPLGLVNRVISDVEHPIDINNQPFTIAATEIWSEFENSGSGVIPKTIVMGDPYDPNSPIFTADLVYSFYISVDHNVHYDKSNGLPISMETFFYMEFTTSFDEYYVGLTFPDGGSGVFNISSGSDGIYESYRGNFLTEASSFYGNVRPTSSGNNRLMEGDLLNYNFSSESYSSMSVDMNLVGSQETMVRTENEWDNSNGEGHLLFDVFRNQDGSFEAVIYMEGQSYGDSSWDFYDNEGGTDNYDSWSNSWGPEPMMFIDDFFAFSNADFEIVPFFDDMMFLDIDDDDDRCDGPDCGPQFSMPNGIPKEGPVNDTTWYINLLDENDGPGQGFVINGFEFTEFNVHEMSQNYKYTQTQIVQMPLGDGQDGQPPLMIDLDMTITLEGKQSFFYDDDTGVMIVMEQRTRADVRMEKHESVWMDHGDGTGEYIQVDIVIEMNIESGFNLFLFEHSNQYQSAPTVISTTDPVTTSDPGTTSDPTSNDTDTTTTDDDTAPGLPVPVPFLPIFAGIVAVSVIARKRK